MSNLVRILSRDHTVWIRALWRSLAGLKARKLCKNQHLPSAFSSAMKTRAEIGCVMQKHFFPSLLSLPVYSLCIKHAADLLESRGWQNSANYISIRTQPQLQLLCHLSWVQIQTQGDEQSQTTSPPQAPFPAPQQCKRQICKLDETILTCLYQKESQVNRDHDCSSATLIYTAVNSGHLWTQAEKQVHELWTNTVCQNTSIIISHGQAKHYVDICRKLIQAINRSPRLTAKGDVWFMLNTRLPTEWEMLKNFKIKVMESQRSSQKSDKWLLTTRENRLKHQLILFFKARTVLPRKCKEKAVNINVGNKYFKLIEQGCTNYTSSQKLQAVIPKSSRSNNI